MASASSRKLPLTFGVEVEFLFAVNNQQVNDDLRYQELLPKNYVLNMNDRVNIYQTFDPEDPETRGLLQSATLLRLGGRTVGALVDDYAGETNLYTGWTLTHEISVIHPRDDETMSEFTNGRVSSVADWSFSGLELISPILQAPKLDTDLFQSKGLRDVKRFLDFMKSVPSPDAPYFFSARHNNAGLHVHFGVEPDHSGPVDMPANMLRHLAWLVLAFEDVISLLHHPERHGYQNTKIYKHGKSNRNNDGTTRPHHPCRPFSPINAFIDIFGYQALNDADARGRLQDLMCRKFNQTEGFAYKTRTVFVNYMNVVPANVGDKITVEFRQHNGTLEAEEVAEWVTFLTALMRTAERKSNEEPQERDVPQVAYDQIITQIPHRVQQAQTLDEFSKYGYLFFHQKRTLEELFDLLELPVERRRYWFARAVKFQGEESARYRGLSCCPPPCKNPPLRDAQGWEEGELGYHPWVSEDEMEVGDAEMEWVSEDEPGDDQADEQDDDYDDTQDAEWEEDH